MSTRSNNLFTRLHEKARLLAGFFILLLLSGCASTPMFPNHLPRKAELSQTPFFPQEEHQCGPAALATVLNFRGLNVTPKELTAQVFLPERQGSLQIELAATSRHYGMLAYPLGANLEDLLTEVAAGNPVLVLQNLAFDWLPQWHYAVVVGYNMEQNEVILRSGKQQRWRSKLSAFNNTWRRSGHWALVIAPPDKIPATATPASFLKAALDLEVSGKQAEALDAYRAASVHWPDDSRTWLALGNGAFLLNHLNEARRALQQALVLEPDHAIALNNLAYVYLQAGCAEQAKKSIRQALQLHPKDRNLLESQSEINAQSFLIKERSCKINH